MLTNISVVIMAKDAQDTIKDTLVSLSDFDEVIVYLNNSTDNTQNICKEFSNVKIIIGDFLGFGPTKNKAATYSKNDWILSLDSDESIPSKLLKEIQKLDLSDEKTIFEIKRDNYFLGKKVKYSGWGKDVLVRLYNKKEHSFNLNMVHEFVELNSNSKKITLKETFSHQACNNINEFLYKVIKYSDLAARDKKTSSFIVVILKSFFAFFKTYIMQLGFLDGWRGFVIAVSNANGRFFRYTKRYINCKVK